MWWFLVAAALADEPLPEVVEAPDLPALEVEKPPEPPPGTEPILAPHDPPPLAAGPGGVVGGDLAGDVRVFHHSELTAKRRVVPVYPKEVVSMSVDEVVCRVRVFVDEKGRPYDHRFESCPAAFRASVTTAVVQWRWNPAVVRDVPVKAQFINFRFVPPG